MATVTTSTGPDEQGLSALETLAAWSTFVAAVLALAAIVYQGFQARKADGRLIAERRLEFELGLLAEMSRQFGITGVQHLHGHARALIRSDTPADEMPILREVTGIQRNAISAAALEALRQRVEQEQPVDEYSRRNRLDDLKRETVARELEQAIETRLNRAT